MQQPQAKTDNSFLRSLKRLSYIIQQYENPEGSVPQKLKTRVTINTIGLVATSIMSAFNTLKRWQHIESTDLALQRKYLLNSRIVAVVMVSVAGLMVYNLYQVYKSIPESRILEIERQSEERLQKFKNQYFKNLEKTKKQAKIT